MRATIVVVLGAFLSSCALLVGLPDVPDTTDGAVGPDGSLGDGSGTGDGTTLDVMGDGGAPDGDGATGPLVTTLASGLNQPYGIAVNGQIYFTEILDAGTVKTCGLDGGGLTTLASSQPFPALIALDAVNAYWTNEVVDGGVMSYALDQSGQATLLTPVAQGRPFGIVTAGGLVYWAAQYDAAVMRCAPTGCAVPTPIASNQGVPTTVAVDSANVFWAASTAGVVRTCAIGGCGSPTTLTSTAFGFPFAIALDSASVYWSDLFGGIYQCAKTGCSSPFVVWPKSPKITPEFVAVDSGNVYWTTGSAGLVMRCPTGGCPGGIATTLATVSGSTDGIAVDATSVYWTNKTAGSVMKLTPK